MNPKLLNDILRESDYAAFREQLLLRVQAEARKRRTRATQWIAAAACLTLFAGALYLNRTQPQTLPATAVAATKVGPRSLIPVLEPIPLKPSQLLQTHSAANIAFSTDRQRHPRAISDNELLALFPRTPVGIAATRSGSKRLIFAEPAHARFFMSSD